MGLRMRLEHPNADCPLGPEHGFSKEAIDVAKRGKHYKLESAVFGSNYTRRESRGYGRIAKRYGADEMAAGRLLAYPREKQRYGETLAEMHIVSGRQTHECFRTARNKR